VILYYASIHIFFRIFQKYTRLFFHYAISMRICLYFNKSFMYVVTVKNFSAFVLAVLNNIQKCYSTLYIGFERTCLLESLQQLRTTKNDMQYNSYKRKCISNREQKRLISFITSRPRNRTTFLFFHTLFL